MTTVQSNVTGRGPKAGPVLARTVTDAARAIGISRAGIYRLAAAGKIKITRIGGRTVVAEAELARLVVKGADLEMAAASLRSARRVQAT